MVSSIKELFTRRCGSKVGVTRQAVYKWENNKSYPDIDNLILLSELYEVTIDELIKESENASENLDKK